MRSLACLAALFSALVPAAAFGQESPDEPMPDPEPIYSPPPVARPASAPPAAYAPPPVTAAVVAPAATISSNADPGQLEDSNIDRTFLMPTAQTQPAGSMTFNDYELFFLGLTYGVTDDIQITGTAMVPLGGDAPWIGILSGKVRLIKSGPIRVAAQAAALWVRGPDIFGDGDGSQPTHRAYSLGGIASYCLDAKCGSLLSVSATSLHSAEGSGNHSIVYGASVVQQLNRRVKLMLEYVSFFENGGENGWQASDGGLVSYGVRFFSSEISGDIGFIKLVGPDAEDDEMPMGFPFINFTYRAL